MTDSFAPRGTSISTEVNLNPGENAALMAYGKKHHLHKRAAIIRELVRRGLKAEGLLG